MCASTVEGKLRKSEQVLTTSEKIISKKMIKDCDARKGEEARKYQLKG
jgi:hypothetical protein